MTKKIRAMLIIEILGRPAEHIVESLKIHVGKISSEKGVNVIDKTIHDAKPLEKGDLYTSFGEIEAEFDKFEDLMNVVFSYMPSHVEIIEPESLTLENSELSNLLTAIMIKLHKYDEIAKKLYNDNSILQRELNNLVQLAKKVQEDEEKAINTNSDTKQSKKKKK